MTLRPNSTTRIRRQRRTNRRKRPALPGAAAADASGSARRSSIANLIKTAACPDKGWQERRGDPSAAVAGRRAAPHSSAHGVAPVTDPDPEFPATAARIARGVVRLMDGLGYSALAEYTLGNGRRADILGIDGAGQVTIVEIKSS